MIYDIVGDIHGYSEKLVTLLKKLGYEQKNNIWQHSERILVSVGDIIDRGPGERETVDMIRRMHEAGKALVVMGNHEYNALGWVKETKQGGYFRAHTAKNFGHHELFLKAALADKAWYQSTLDWFSSLPIYLDLPNFRIVHACWHEASIERLQPYLTKNQAFKPEVWDVLLDNKHPEHQAVYDALEVLTKGWEMTLPEGRYFIDPENNKRTKIRTQWWVTQKDITYQTIALSVPNPSVLPDTQLEAGALPGYASDKPLFFGHYWMRGKQPQILNKNIACVDWTVVPPNSMLAAYAYQGEKTLKNEHFVFV